ncbi:uncharacterized protein LOC135229321, partial [Loxodonta africana]|uniref:uncharacterized protein LOC135229321 n=1 Tax=Loxodonta africana TaxID=9785 RepID=UPI0030D41704
ALVSPLAEGAGGGRGGQAPIPQLGPQTRPGQSRDLGAALDTAFLPKPFKPPGPRALRSWIPWLDPPPPLQSHGDANFPDQLRLPGQRLPLAARRVAASARPHAASAPEDHSGWGKLEGATRAANPTSGLSNLWSPRDAGTGTRTPGAFPPHLRGARLVQSGSWSLHPAAGVSYLSENTAGKAARTASSLRRAIRPGPLTTRPSASGSNWLDGVEHGCWPGPAARVWGGRGGGWASRGKGGV